MRVLGEWNRKQFFVDPGQIYTPTAMTFQRSAKMKDIDKKNSAMQYVDGNEPAQATMEITLSALLGVNVQDEYDWWMHSAVGARSTLVIGGHDMLKTAVALTTCAVSDLKIFPATGEVYEAKLKLTFKEAAKKPAAKKGKKKKGKKPERDILSDWEKRLQEQMNQNVTSTVIKP